MQFPKLKDYCEKQSLKSSINSKSSVKELQNQNDQSQSEQSQEINFSSETSLIAYKKIFSDIQGGHRSLSDLLFELKKHGVCYNQNFLKEQKKRSTLHKIQIVSMKNTKHFQVVTLTVSLGPYSQQLKIYNTFSSSILNQISQIYQGKSTRIHCFKYKYQNLIVKTINFQKIQTNNFKRQKQQFFSILKEYFIGKMMSILQIGPKICKEFGFDIFLSETNAYFFLENCKKFKNKSFDKSENLALKKSLREMHELSIIHRDIKPDNIMYSPSFKKYVFIDFQLSEYRKQNLGQLICTKFAGTYSYCTEEVKLLFKSKENAWVDLHWNDAYGLEISLDEMTRKYLLYSTKKQKNIFFQDNQLNDFLTEVNLKFLLFSIKNSDFSQIERISQELYRPIMTFFYEIPLTQEIRKIYLDFLEDYGESQKGFQDLKEIFSNKIYFSSFKGKRQFESIEEKRKIETVRQFYEEIQLSQKVNKKNHKLPIKQLQEVLFDKNCIEDLKPYEYERYLIEYLSFKRIDPVISVERKIQACKMYSSLKSFKIEDQFKQMSAHQMFDWIFHEILQTLPTDWIMQNFSVYLTALSNYFIVSENMDVQIIQKIAQVIDSIENDKNLSFLDKIQQTLMIKFSLISANNGIYTTQIFIKFGYIGELIKFQVIDWASMQTQIQEQSEELTICEIYVSCLEYFSFEYTCSAIIDSYKIKQKIQSVNSKSTFSLLLLNFIEYRLLCNLEDCDNITTQRRQKEEIILQEMENQNELNGILIHVIYFYAKSIEIKIFKKYITILDNCYQLQSIYRKFFLPVRLYIEILEYDQNPEQKFRLIQLQNIEKKMKEYFMDEINEKNIVINLKKMQNLYFIYFNLYSLQKPLPPIIMNQLYSKIFNSFPKYLEIYESINKQIIYRGSKNLLYLQLLMQDIQLKCLNSLKNHQHIWKNEKILDQYYLKLCQFCPNLQSFHKIAKIDRSTFNDEDHMYLLFFDIIWLKCSGGQNWLQNIFSFLKQKKNIISSMIPILKFQQKDDISRALRQVLFFLLEENDIQILSNGIDVIYSIVQNKLFIQGNILNFNSRLVKIMIKLNRFEQILYEIIQTSKLYTDQISSFQIVQLDNFYSFLIENVYHEKKEKQFSNNLNNLLPKISIKKIPLFSLFLIYCILPENRKIIIKMLFQSLLYLKPNARHFLLSKFYKELVKNEEFCSVRKKKYYLKKCVRYPQKQTQNVEKIKYHLNCETKLSSFQGVFKKNLESKILRLSKYCEIYLKNKITLDDHNVVHENKFISN